MNSASTLKATSHQEGIRGATGLDACWRVSLADHC